MTFLTPHVQTAGHQGHQFSYNDLQEQVRDMCRRYPAQNPSNNKSAPKGVYTAQFDGLVDLVEDNGAVAFLVKTDAQLQVCSQVERDGTLYLPPPKDQIPWVLPRGEEVLRHYQADTDAVLYDDLLSYHKGISELPHEDDYDLLASWDIHTYLLEQFQYTPILWLFAVPERGKSRTGKGIIYVAYRGT